MPFNTATPITPGLLNDSLTGDPDYFSFTLTSRSAIALSLTGLGANADLELFNGNQSLIRASSNPGSAGELINSLLDPGNYYVRVSGNQTPYSLSFQQEPTTQTEVFWRNSATGENLIWVMDGSSITAGIALDSVSTDWEMVGAADFNRDGFRDLLWRNRVSGIAGAWLMNQTQVTAWFPVTSLTAHLALTVGDFNQDTHPDVVIRGAGEAGNELHFILLLVDGQATAVRELPAVGLNWTIAAAADFNSDGKPDILWRNQVTGDNGIWIMDGTQPVGYEALPNVFPGDGWELTGAADFNQDGKPDLLWRNGTVNGIWLLNGSQVTGYDSLIAVGADWQPKPYSAAVERWIDSAGATIATAFDVGVLETIASYQEHLTGTEADVFQFTLTNLTPQELIATAPGQTVELLDASFQPIPNLLAAGIYYVRVTGSGNYTLTLENAPPPLPVVTVSSVVNASEPSMNGSFTISRSGPVDQALTVNYAIAGTATPGSDYQSVQSVVIPVGQTSVTIPVTVIDDEEEEDSETIILTLASSSAYTIGTTGSGTLTLSDDDSLVIAPGDAGNTLETAKNLGTLRTVTITQSDRVDNSDKKDYYRFALASRSTIRATVTGLTADIDIELLNAAGQLIDFSDNSGTASESLNRTLLAGTYYLFIYPYGNSQSNYTLNLWKV